MNSKDFFENIKPFIELETENAEKLLKNGDSEAAFRHLERAHVLGQSITSEHTRVHWLMLKSGWKRKNFREIFGQIIRIIGAATKTPFGIYPQGNTGGADVWFFKPLPVPQELQQIIEKAGAK